MAAKVKFPLKMTNGTQVRTLEDLREHFDLISVLAYYDSGRLYDWLTVYYYDEEVEKIKALDSSAPDFKKSLCDILGVQYAEDKSVGVDLSDISKRNERLAKLRTLTSDEAILAAVDNVVFTQKELDSLQGKDIDVIYLCGEQFNISADKRGIRYIGVNNPKVSIPDNLGEINIVFTSVEFDLDGIIAQAKSASDHVKAVELWRMAAERGHAEADCGLGQCYLLGNGVDKNEEEAVKWFRKAAEQGHAEAQYELGICYCCYGGRGVDENEEEGAKWLRKAAKQGNLKAVNQLLYMELDCKKVLEWLYKAAEKGNADAQYRLAQCYRCGEYVDENEEEAQKWYRKAAEQGRVEALDQLYYDDDTGENIAFLCKLAEQGHAEAQYKLGICYDYGTGVDQNEEEAVKWFCKAAEQGDKNAKDKLIKLDPKSYELLDVLLYSLGGLDNISCNPSFNSNDGKISIQVEYRNNIDTTVLNQFGATNILVETIYDKTYEERPLGQQFKRIFALGVSEFDMKYEEVDIDYGKGAIHFCLPTIDMNEMQDCIIIMQKQLK